ncbi:MAG: hypothetical protein AAF600_19105 [Bacteroidota bacterium]
MCQNKKLSFKLLKFLTWALLFVHLILTISCSERERSFDYFGQSRTAKAEPFITEKNYLKGGFLIDPQGEYVIFGKKSGKEWYH